MNTAETPNALSTRDPRKSLIVLSSPALLRTLSGSVILNTKRAGRNHLSAEPRLGGDYRFGLLNMRGGAAWLSGLVATLVLLPE